MSLWQLLKPHIGPGLVRFVLLAAGLGLLMGILSFRVGRIGAAIVSQHTGSSDLPTVMGILIAAGVAQFLVVRQVSRWFSRATAASRKNLLARFARLEPVMLYRVPAEEMRHAVGTLHTQLNDLAPTAALAVRGVVWSACTAGTLLLFWDRAAGWTLLVVYAVLALYVASAVIAMRRHELVAVAFDGKVLAGLGDLLGGFKELVLNPAKSAVLFREAILQRQADRRIARASYRRGLARAASLGQAVEPLAILPCVVAMALYPTDQESATVTLLVLVCAPFAWLQIIPQLVSADASARRLLDLEGKLAQAGGGAIAPPAAAAPDPFESLELSNAEYCHPARPGAPGFIVGPVSCRFDAGTITFVTGANGSGKSTLIRLLSGLYPAAGQALLNHAPVELRAYRSLFSTVLACPAPLDRLYGLDDVDPDGVNALLDRFALGHITRFEAGRFTCTRLSASQRKRVALAATLMERKPILVLDEWAAEQDPEIRRDFYRNLLPSLRAEGRTVIAVTQDDRYFDACDQRIEMAGGRIVATKHYRA